MNNTGVLVWFFTVSICVLAPRGMAADCEPGALQASQVDAYLRAYDSLGPHRSGTAGDKKTAAYLSRKFSELGYDVSRQDFPVPDHSVLDADALLGEARVELVAQPPVSQQREMSGHLVYWSYREGIDIPVGGDQSILLVELPAARYSSFNSYSIRGLLGEVESARPQFKAIILITNGASGEAQLLNVRPGKAEIPLFLVAPRRAQVLRQAALRHEQVTIRSRVSAGSLQASNVIATRLQPGKPHIVISTPISGWGHSVGERGPGFAGSLSIADWARCALPDHSLTFVATSGHELVNLGSEHYLDTLAPEPEVVALWLHLGAGWGARDYQDLGASMLPLEHADSYRFLMVDATLKPFLSRKFKSMPGLANAHTFDEGSAGGELSDIHARGYRAFGLFGAHKFHHVASDRYLRTGTELVLPVLDALQESLSAMANANLVAEPQREGD